MKPSRTLTCLLGLVCLITASGHASDREDWTAASEARLHIEVTGYNDGLESVDLVPKFSSKGEFIGFEFTKNRSNGQSEKNSVLSAHLMNHPYVLHTTMTVDAISINASPEFTPAEGGIVILNYVRSGRPGAAPKMEHIQVHFAKEDSRWDLREEQTGLRIRGGSVHAYLSMVPPRGGVDRFSFSTPDPVPSEQNCNQSKKVLCFNPL